MVGTLRVLEGARRPAAGRVVFAASGGTLYGEPDDSELPLKESLPQRPLSPYGVSKKAAIDYLVAYRELHALEFCGAGPGQRVRAPPGSPRRGRGGGHLRRAAGAGEPVTIFGDGEQTRDFVYVDDVVDAFVRAASRGRRPGLQHRHRARDLGQPALRRDGDPGRRRAADRAPAPAARRAAAQLPRPGARRHPARLEPVDRARATGTARPCSTSCADGWVGRRLTGWPHGRPAAQPADPPDSQRNRSSAGGRMISSATDAGRSQAGSTPRTTAAGMPAVLAHDQLGGAGQLVGDADLGGVETRPLASGVPRRSTTAATPATPMATSVTPCRQVRPKVSEMTTPTETPCRCRRASRMRRAERSGSTGRRAAVPLATLDRSTPALAQTNPCRVSVMSRSPRRRSDPHRLAFDQGRLASGRPASTATSRPRPWTRPSG